MKIVILYHAAQAPFSAIQLILENVDEQLRFADQLRENHIEISSRIVNLLSPSLVADAQKRMEEEEKKIKDQELMEEKEAIKNVIPQCPGNNPE